MKKLTKIILLIFIISASALADEQKQQTTEQPTPPKGFNPQQKLNQTAPKPPTAEEPSDLAKEGSPEKTVELFLAMDLSGDRNAGQYKKMQKLTNWGDPLKWDMYLVVDKWGITESKKKEDKAFVTVRFDLAGRVVKDEFFIKETGTEDVEILLLYNKNKKLWEIVSSQFAPHVHVKALPEGMKEISVEEKSESQPGKDEGFADVHD